VHIYLDIIILIVALVSSGLFALAAQPRFRALIFGASLVSFIAGLVAGHWI